MSDCSGPQGEAWSAPHSACVGTSAQTSCDSINQTTCYYAFLLTDEKVAWFSGQFLVGHGLKIHEPAALANHGIKAGDFVDQINGAMLSDEATLLAVLAPFTESMPATVVSTTHLLGRFQISLSH